MFLLLTSLSGGPTSRSTRPRSKVCGLWPKPVTKEWKREREREKWKSRKRERSASAAASFTLHFLSTDPISGFTFETRAFIWFDSSQVAWPKQSRRSFIFCLFFSGVTFILTASFTQYHVIRSLAFVYCFPWHKIKTRSHFYDQLLPLQLLLPALAPDFVFIFQPFSSFALAW